MSDFKIKFKKVRNEINDGRSMSSTLRSTYERTKSARDGLDWDVASKRRIEQRLRRCEEDMLQQRDKLDKLFQSLDEILSLYGSTESALCEVKLIQPEEKKWYEHTNQSIKNDLLDKNSIIWTSLRNNQKISNTSGFQKSEQARDGIQKFFDDHYKEIKPATKKGTVTYDSTNKKFTYQSVDINDNNAVDQFDADMNAKKLATDVKAFHIGDTFWDWSAWHFDNSEDLDTPWNLSADVAKVNGYWEAYGGLFYQDPVTGQRSFLPGIGAMAGVSFSALTASAYGDFGNDMLGAYVGTTQTVGKAEAYAGGQLGVTKDAQGKTNFNAYVGAGAGAYLYEGTASAGAKVLGADVGVTGKVNVGIGAHANAGFKDGVLSVDIGASLGVGGSVSLSVDVSGTVDAICEGATSAWEEITGWFD